jgi:hypothetical protein
MSKSAPDLILFIHGGNHIDVHAADVLRCRFASFGYRLADISLVDRQAHIKLQALLRDHRDELFCYLSSNFWALNIRNDDRLLHSLTGIPLVIFLHDHPLYFLGQVSSSLEGVLILGLGADTEDFMAKHYPFQATMLSQSTGPWFTSADVPPEPNRADFMSRKNGLLCPMNLTIYGDNIDDIWAAIKALPTSRRQRVVILLEAALTDCLTPLHVISERQTAAGNAELDVADLPLVSNFVKLWRRTRIVEMLIELPIIISTNYAPAMLERKYPNKFTLLTVPETLPLYKAFRFIVNSTPLMTEVFHDRVTEALENNSVCITDPNAVLARHFSDGKEMIFIDYQRFDLAEKVSMYLDDPERAFEMTVDCYRVWSKMTAGHDAYRRLIEAVARKREEAALTN